MCVMEKAATDIYTFDDLRKRGYSYVDKTAILKELADDSRGGQFFIARPRRFGKSQNPLFSLTQSPLSSKGHP